MTDSFAMFVAVTLYKATWFSGQAIVFYVLWNLAMPDLIGMDSLGFIDSILIYAVLRMIVDPPQLKIEIN